MNHTYLFEQASWEVKGYYIGESGQLVEAEGKSIITHQRENMDHSRSNEVADRRGLGDWQYL